MKKLSKQKTNQLVQVIVVTLVVLAGLWFGLIKYQLGQIDDLKTKKEAATATYAKVLNTIKNRAQVDGELAATSAQLDKEEDDMAAGDLNSWLFSFLRKFKSNYPVDIPQYGSGSVGTMKLFPGFPYQEVSVTIAGTGFYHDVGRFLADFENQYPYARLSNLELEPASVQSPGDKEKLSFKVGISMLIRPNAPRVANNP